MKTLTIKQLIPMLASFPGGAESFKNKLVAHIRPMRRLWRLLSNPANRITTLEGIHKFVFQNDDYKRHQLITLKNQMREALTDFVELLKLRTTARGQNLRAELYEEHGYQNWADKANKTSLQLAPDEAEAKRWLASYEAYTVRQEVALLYC